MTFPITLTLGTKTITIPVNDTNTRANRNLDVVYTNSEWVEFHINQALGLPMDSDWMEDIPF